MFKVGDKVKIIKADHYQGDDMVGKTGRIRRIRRINRITAGIFFEVYFQKHSIDNEFTWWEDELELAQHTFTTPAPEPEVAKSQQWLADRLSEAENEQDEHWLGEGLA